MLNLEKGEIINMIKAKHIGIVHLTILVGMILFGLYLFDDQASSSTMVPESPLLLANAFVTDGTSSVVPAILTPMLPSQQFIIPPLSARQACIQTPGWQWREGGGFAMCFRSGHAMCPIGHPWMTRITPNYTICVSFWSGRGDVRHYNKLRK
jgi:hypothetical protein